MNEEPSGAYYADRLSAARLRRCYEVAPPRVQQYLSAEIEFVRRRLRPGDRVLELGCGYGRALAPLIEEADLLFGIDTSVDSLTMGADTIGGCCLAAMDAAALGFLDSSFDVVFCIQNGISVFGVDPARLVREAIRVARPGGNVMFSSYAERFWHDRLEWFRIQAAHGLIGEIDEEACGNGVIVCKDGFRAHAVSPEQFQRLAAASGEPFDIVEVDRSSVFCVISLA
jgi:2-polyprenyl-6-hydroxyphenyl methylase/3-demethylubiquinone-9 3-methyltransferase